MIQMLDLPRLHAPLRDDLIRAFTRVLDSGQFVLGEEVSRFERLLGEFLEARVIGVSSGTDALLIGLMALGVRPGDEVIVPAYSFIATADVITRLGARPVFVDIDRETYNIDPELIEHSVTDKTVGIIPVHLFGHPAEMNRIMDVADRNDLWVLEDAAQAIGAIYHRKYVGTIGRLGAFSFFPSKNLGGLGDAGAIVHGPDDAKKLAMLRQHGSEEKYRHDIIGGNFRLDAIQAALLRVKLFYLSKWEHQRRAIARIYRDEIQGIHPVERFGCRHVYNQYVIRCDKREEVIASLKGARIAHAVYYPIPLHLQPCFLGYKAGDFPEAEHAARETVAIPIDPMMTEDEIGAVCRALR